MTFIERFPALQSSLCIAATCLLVAFDPLPSSAQELNHDLLFDIEIEVGGANTVGSTRLGDRGIYTITGGHFEGPTLKGKVLDGADWAIVRQDGTIDLDVRATLQTDDGDIIYMHYDGFLTAPPDVMAALGEGGAVTGDQYYMRTTPRFEVSTERLAWLNKSVFVGVGRITATGVGYRVYTIK